LDRAIILDCTLRDGSYSIDFKFTASDTAVLTGQLAALGIEWIEIGHGLGLGAMEAGKGDMPATDLQLIRAAKAHSGSAKIGMFFIPSLASRDQLQRARDAGLDFIRIGDNAPDVEQTYPYIAYAKTLGLSPSLNVMKSYAITPAQFAKKAKGAREAGADIVYCVDSAGCMLPDDVARYVDAAMNTIDCPLGFHGHNGLMMAVANCVRAYQHGARFIDTTLCGLGRGAGNAPTEVTVAVFDQMGIPTGIDLFKVMEVAQYYVRPLMSGRGTDESLELVAARYRFHNSYMPTVETIAARHHVDLRRLVAEAGTHDPVRLDVAHLDAAARALAAAGATPPDSSRDALLQFDDRAFAAAPANDPADLTRALVDGLGVMRAKRPGSEAVLLLAPALDGEQPAAEFILADEHQALGRITYASLDALRTIVSIALAKVSLFLVDVGAYGSMDDTAAAVELAGAARVIPVRPHDLQTIYVREVIDRILAARSGVSSSALLYRHTQLVRDAVAGLDLGPDGPVRIERVDADAALAPSGFDLILCGAEPDCEEAARLVSLLTPAGTILIVDIRPYPRDLPAPGARTIRLNLNLAFCGIFERHREQAGNGVRASTNDRHS
jgi:4-hydroxy 2-oxovalerate aldolase